MENDLNYESLLDDSRDDGVIAPPGVTSVPETESSTIEDSPAQLAPGIIIQNSDLVEDSDKDNVLYDFLKGHGIEDPSKMKFRNDKNEIEDVDFSKLSREEQLNILTGITDSGLTQQEIADINFLRKNGINLSQYGSTVSKNSVEQYINQHSENVPQKTYQIDDYTDDELYLADLKSKYPDFSDEEILSKLESAKDNEDLYQKEVTALRNSYKEDEDNYLKQQEAIRQQQYVALQNNLINAARNFNEVLLDPEDPESDSLVVEDSDRQQIMSYLLDQDSQGKSQLVKDLENPNTLIQLAWLRLQGQNAIADTSHYWKETLKETRKENARLQKEINKLKGKKDNSVVVETQAKNLGDAWDRLI